MACETIISQEIREFSFSFSFKRVALSPERRNAPDILDNMAAYVANLGKAPFHGPPLQ